MIRCGPFEVVICSGLILFSVDAGVSSAVNGNVLEAINLAVNGRHTGCWRGAIYLFFVTIFLSLPVAVFAKYYVDCNFLMTGQQVVIVTAGSGAFQVATHPHSSSPTHSLTP